MDIQSAHMFGKLIGAGLAAIGVAGAGAGIGSVFAALVSTIGRNPASRSHVFGIGMLGFALSEATGLFALLVSFMILFS